VKDRVYFQKGDAANLDFADASFDAEISNFVFHEVRSQPDKLALIREALRVLKPDGVFVFEDIFFAKSHYGEMKDFVKQLKSYASEIHFVDTRHPDFAPEFLNTPLVLGQMGLIYGRK
jgi:ubiquinone/menaquinone biosynthesis C-methylase UbiE